MAGERGARHRGDAGPVGGEGGGVDEGDVPGAHGQLGGREKYCHARWKICEALSPLEIVASQRLHIVQCSASSYYFLLLKPAYASTKKEYKLIRSRQKNHGPSIYPQQERQEPSTPQPFHRTHTHLRPRTTPLIPASDNVHPAPPLCRKIPTPPKPNCPIQVKKTTTLSLSPRPVQPPQPKKGCDPTPSANQPPHFTVSPNSKPPKPQNPPP